MTIAVVPDSGIRRPRPAPSWLIALVVSVLGVGGGALTEHLQGVLDDPWAMWANSVAAWCVPAFAAGAMAVRLPVAVVAGIVTELLLVTSYYVTQSAQGVPHATSTAVGWLVAGVVAGVVFGVAGAWWRTGDARRGTLSVALLAGVLVSEGLVRAVRFPWQGSSGVIMAAAGVVIALLLGRSWRQRAAVLGLLVVIVPLGLLGMELVDRAFAAF
ncbi:DUF6518 family protein [Blastococcus xanthinilyticus]|uniref:Uncharacterized protein n=1 Tax=Blastococcus xanthinilyticus TaxID=1564164 RepID=A0A5S5D2Y7_9ACTN|nr:DUF6518 family protein [Blastococcus xanthinilyticus]TYP90393.1 hypothetical protein BD833_101111 [Blastococcus xanthinilyticus]